MLQLMTTLRASGGLAVNLAVATILTLLRTDETNCGLEAIGLPLQFGMCLTFRPDARGCARWNYAATIVMVGTCAHTELQ